jgi:hypothetical protein
MTENATAGAPSSKPSGGNAAASPAPATSIAAYEQQRQHLKELINRRRMLEKQLVCLAPFLPLFLARNYQRQY